MEPMRAGARNQTASEFPSAVVILPRADRERQSPVITELIRSLAQRHGLDFLDLSDAFDGLELEQFRVSAWDRHPSTLGHRALFQALRSELLRRGTLPGLPLGSAGSDPVMVTSSRRYFPEAAQSSRERAMTGASTRKSRSRSFRI